MNRKLVLNLLICLFLVALFGCDRNQETNLSQTSAVNKTPPAGRSINFSDRSRQNEFKKSLIKAGVKFKTITALDKEWIVWDFKDTETVIGHWEFYPEQIKMFRAFKSEFEHDRKIKK